MTHRHTRAALVFAILCVAVPAPTHRIVRSSTMASNVTLPVVLR